MNEQELMQLVKQGYDQFKSGDIQALMQNFTDDIEWAMPDIPGVPFAGTRHGKQQFIQFAQSFNQALRTDQFEPREFFVQGDKVVVIGYFSGEAIPTGRPVENEWVHVFSYRDGKLARFQQFSDTAATQAAFAGAQVGTARGADATLLH